MKTGFKVMLVLVAFAAMAAAAERYDLVRMDLRSRADVRTLEAMGCVVNGPDATGRTLVEIPESRLAQLERDGYSIELVRADIRTWYKQNGQDARFHTYTEMKDTFMLLAQSHPGICKFETLGYASNDSLYYALKITDNPTIEEDEPEVMFEGAMHGDEKCGTEALFNFAEYLVSSYGSDPQMTYLIDNREIWIVCPANPYGHIHDDRLNANQVDCNRDWGFLWNHETSEPGPFTQPETQMLAGLAHSNAFSHWTEYHGGTYMVSTSWSYTDFGTRDSNELQYLAQQWSSFDGYPYGPGYRVMYQINGSSKDYAYGTLAAYGQSVECCIDKTPPAESLAPIIARERNAMRNELILVDRGIRGTVTDSVSGAPVVARVTPLPQDFPGFCDWPGDYHRYLRPGTYSVKFEANGYAAKTVPGVVVTADTVTWLSVQLAPDTTQPVTLLRYVHGEGDNTATMPSTPDWSLGPHDGRRYSLGQGGYAAFDFGQQIFNLAGNDFTVYEDDADPEGYSVAVANDWLGPWTALGNGTGTQGFDLGAGGVSMCRYIKITDDNSSSSGPTAGFDLDAVEAIMSSQAALVYMDRAILDSAPGGNNDGRLDPGETAGLVLAIKNVGRQGVTDVHGTLVTADPYVTVLDSTGEFGALPPDTVRWNWADQFRVSVSPSCPREHEAAFRLRMSGGYTDSFDFTIGIGAVTQVDSVPDTGALAPRYHAYDDIDAGYEQHPTYNWVEVAGIGTHVTLADDETQTVSLPSGFGPFRFYDQNYTQVSICGNGWVGLGSTSVTSYSNTALPAADLPPAFVLNWDDLFPPTGGGVWYYHDAANHRFIVEYDSVPYYANQTMFEKYEVMMYDTSVAAPDGNCEFVYQYQTANGFSSSTVGMQEPSTWIQLLLDGAYHRASAPIAAGRAIKFTTQFGNGIEEGAAAKPGSVLSLVAAPTIASGDINIKVSVPHAGRTRLAVYDAQGRLVRTLAATSSLLPATSLAWNGSDAYGRRLPPGVYVIRLELDGASVGHKVVLSR